MKPSPLTYATLLAAALILAAPGRALEAKQTSLDSRIIEAFENIDERTSSHEQNVVERAKSLGVDENTEARVREMARLSAPFTHPRANRRFEPFIFRIEDGTVVWMDRIENGERRR